MFSSWDSQGHKCQESIEIMAKKHITGFWEGDEGVWKCSGREFKGQVTMTASLKRQLLNLLSSFLATDNEVCKRTRGRRNQPQQRSWQRSTGGGRGGLAEQIGTDVLSGERGPAPSLELCLIREVTRCSARDPQFTSLAPITHVAVKAECES